MKSTKSKKDVSTILVHSGLPNTKTRKILGATSPDAIF